VATTTEARAPADVLAWGRELLEPALREAVGTLPSAVAQVSAFHLGWSDEHGNPTAGSGGKAFRPTLALLAAEAAGGAHEAALPAAVAVELVHNFSLLHDDVMDDDVLRRHRPTAWSVFGVGPAILAGDALLALAFETLAAGRGEHARSAVQMLGETVQQLIDGQMRDLAFETRADICVDDVLTMARAKTGALLGCSCALGELMAGGDERSVALMRSFGERLGLAFQLVDDILGIWGDPAVTGKAIHSDITARKKSLPVVAALTSDTPAGRELVSLYGRGGALSGDDVASAAQLVALAGGRAWSEAEASRQLGHALEDLRCARAGGRATGELKALATLVTTRDR
jgi:geranylgeranyl diphosphate synthase type I